jgi:hypothetical protein
MESTRTSSHLSRALFSPLSLPPHFSAPCPVVPVRESPGSGWCPGVGPPACAVYPGGSSVWVWVPSLGVGPILWVSRTRLGPLMWWVVGWCGSHGCTGSAPVVGGAAVPCLSGSPLSAGDAPRVLGPIWVCLVAHWVPSAAGGGPAACTWWYHWSRW